MDRDLEKEGETPLEDFSGLLVPAKNKQALDRYEFLNCLEAEKTYFLAIRVTDKKMPFSFQWLMKVHYQMFGKVWRWAGEPRKTVKNLGVEPHQIGAAIHRFSHDLKTWESSEEDPFKISVKIHHRLVWIHPFENGNGRWARFLTNLYLYKKGLRMIYWTQSAQSYRQNYLQALRMADEDSFDALHDLQKKFQDHFQRKA